MDKEMEMATEAFLKATTAKEQAELAYDEARKVFLDTLSANGLTEVTYADLRITASPATRRSWDLDTLKKHLTPAMFRRVTQPAIDTKAWDSAVEKGEISAKVIKAVVEVATSVRVLVKPAKGAQKPATASKPAKVKSA